MCDVILLLLNYNSSEVSILELRYPIITPYYHTCVWLKMAFTEVLIAYKSLLLCPFLKYIYVMVLNLGLVDKQVKCYINDSYFRKLSKLVCHCEALKVLLLF